MGQGRRLTTGLAGAASTNKGRPSMRKNFAFLLGTVTGVCLTLAVTGSLGTSWVAAAKAAARSDAYTQLNLFGNVFERIKTSYVEKPDDSKLMEGAINGMISSLDPHSRYMNDGLRDEFLRGQ